MTQVSLDRGVRIYANMTPWLVDVPNKTSRTLCVEVLDANRLDWKTCAMVCLNTNLCQFAKFQNDTNSAELGYDPKS